MARVLALMGRPQGQYPLIHLFVGRATKAQALRSLYPQNNTGRQGGLGFARLHYSPVTHPHTVLFIDGSLSRPKAKCRSAEPFCRYHIQNSHGRSYQDIQGLLYRRFLLPRADTWTLFADDIGGIPQLENLLSTWSTAPISDFGSTTVARPRLIVVLNDPQDMAGHSQDVENTLRAIAVPALVASVCVLDLRDRTHWSPDSRFEPLRRLLSRELEEAYIARCDAHELFSAVHLDWILRKSLLHVAGWPTAPFDCIRACHLDRSPGDQAERHLQLFLALAERCEASTNAVVPYIASALLMNAYPPGMHGFDPKAAFRTLYAKDCVAACSTSSFSPASTFCELVETEFASLFHTLSSGVPAARIRRAILRKSARVWSRVQSTHVCLFCLRRAPEHMLPCEHAMCEVCVQIFGIPGRGAEYHFELSSCPLCLARFSCVIRVLPPTKRPTVLVLDGGGVRGVVTLGFLADLEKRIGGSRGLREAFDLNMGTSVGAVIVSEVIDFGRPVAEAHAKFNALARQIFRDRPQRQTILGQTWDFLATWMSDSRHDSNSLDRALQYAFGPTRRLFAPAAPLVAGARVALTASQVDNDGLFGLFCNYRGAGRSWMQSAYKLFLSSEKEPEPLLWEVTRCSVAALGYFTPKHLPGIGTFQDGGVRANCPLRTALRESEIVWPACKRPDLVVSIGTGYAADDVPRTGEPGRRWLRDGFIDRALRTFLHSPAVDGRRGWQDALDTVPDDVRGSIYRLDRQIPGTAPELDDTSALDSLGDFAYTVPDSLVRDWLAKTFFFEFDAKPEKIDGYYRCQGSILCCKFDAPGIVHQTELNYTDARFLLRQGCDLGAVNEHDGCFACGYYRKRVSFCVLSVHETVQLGIRGTMGFCSVGGFPTCIEELMESQQVDTPFGRPDHRSDQWPPSRRCYCQSQKRSHPAEMERTPKRPRL